MSPAALPPPPFWRTLYFERQVRQRPDRAELRPDDILAALESPVRVRRQPDGRLQHWYYVARMGKWVRVVTLGDGTTVHNAFLDRSFRP